MRSRALFSKIYTVFKRLIFLWLALCGAVAVQAAGCAPATSGGGASASWPTICWLDMSGYSDAQVLGAGQSFSFTLADGAVLSFTLTGTSSSPVTSPATGFNATATPVSSAAAMGNSAFLGVAGKPALVTSTTFSTVHVTMNGITLTPPSGVSTSANDQIIFADAEVTINRELLSFTTNGGNWTQISALPPTSGSTFPATTNTGSTVTETAGNATAGGYAFATTNPTTLTASLTAAPTQAMMIGLRAATLTVTSQVSGARAAASDQFSFDATRSSGGAAVTSGSSSGTGNGPFATPMATLFASGPLTITENMAAGSASSLGQYTTILTCTNATAGSTTVLPSSVAGTSAALPALNPGDQVTCSFTNTARPATVAIASGLTGLTYTQTNLTSTPVPPTPVTVTTLGTAVTLTAQVPSGYTLTSASCTDSNAAITSNTGSIGTLSGTVLTIPASAVRAGAAFICTFGTVQLAPQLSITMAAPAPALGVTVNSTYVLTVTNNGNTSTSTAQVVDVLPAGLTFVSANGPNWTCRAVGQTVTCDFSGSTIAQGASSAINLVVTPQASVIGTSVTNYASVDPTGGSAPPAPGASCTPTSACANVVSASVLADPASTAVFAVIKTADKDTAEMGDVVKYTIELRLTGTGTLPAVSIEDTLPRGFMYIANTSSVVVNGGAAALKSDAMLGVTPSTSPLVFALGAMNPGDDVKLSYAVRIGAGAQSGDGINRADALYSSHRSAVAQVQVKVTSGIFWDEACVFGHVYIDKNSNGLKDEGETGIANVRLYLEDGTWFITDSDGKYSYCGLTPITHVIGVDQTTLPSGSVLEITSNRNALDSASQFLDVQYGELMRADFAVMPPPKPTKKHPARLEIRR